MRSTRKVSAKILVPAILLVAWGGYARAAASDPPGRVARLSQIQGNISVEPSGVNQWTQASPNYPLTTGDRLYADQDGRAELQMGQMVAYVWHDTDLSVTDLDDQTAQLGLSQGTLRVRTLTLDPGQNVEVDTPNGAITVMQPGDFRVDSYTGDGGTVVTVNSGEVQITGPNLSQNLRSGQSVRLNGTNPITVTSLLMPGEDPFDAWCFQQTRKILEAQSRQYVNPDTAGLDDLDQYGAWAQSPDYGPVWYPAAVPVGWVPYSVGSWVWVQPWGWTWVDADPWGFAPFHYGRWMFFGSRWGWIPGPVAVAPVYSPALVGFVGGPGFAAGFGFGAGVGMTAWFPLGPGEPFYPWYQCGPRYFTQVNITNINRVTNITNINTTNYYNYYHNPNRLRTLHFANRDVATTAVRASQFASGQPITPRTAFHPTARQLAHAQLIPHPFVRPTIRNVVPRAVHSVPVAAARPSLITPRGEQRAVPGAKTSSVPYRPLPSSMVRSETEARGTQPGTSTTAPDRTSSPSRYGQPNTKGAQRNGIPRSYDRTPNGNLAQPGYGNGGNRGLIYRNPPPEPRPSFQQRQPYMGRDPGRPLDDRQLDNIWRGRPAGPPREMEFPPHPSFAPRMSAPRMSYGPMGGRPR